VEGHRQPLQVRVQVGPHRGLDLVGGARDQQPPQQDQARLDGAEREHAEDEPGQHVEPAARDRPVDDGPGDERDRQPGQGGSEGGDTAADEGGAVRADVGQQAAQLAQGWGGWPTGCQELFAHGVKNARRTAQRGHPSFGRTRMRAGWCA